MNEEDWRALLLPLAAAQDALARLEATAALASDPVRDGLCARLALAEAAGWLHHRGGVWVSPTDLALRETGLVGAWGLAGHAGRLADAMPDTVQHDPLSGPSDDRLIDDRLVGRALALARHWRSLAADGDPERLERALVDLGGRPIDGEAGQDWLAAMGDNDLPPLLRAARLAEAWQAERAAREDGGAFLSPAALFAAAAVWRGRRLDALPTPLWSAPAALLQALALAPALRRTGPGLGPGWVAGLLGIATAAAGAALVSLHRLRDAERRGLALAASVTGRSSLGRAAEAALCCPVLTPRMLAARLGVSTRAGLALAGQLAEGGLLREVTGRGAWRAYALELVRPPAIGVTPAEPAGELALEPALEPAVAP